MNEIVLKVVTVVGSNGCSSGYHFFEKNKTAVIGLGDMVITYSEWVLVVSRRLYISECPEICPSHLRRRRLRR
jgi:hypothetical protein